MKIGKAAAIFINIDSAKYTEEEKLEAIYDVMNMPTHNSFSKSKILDALRWLWHSCVQIEEAEEPTCSDACDCCQYIGEGDFICDELQEIVIDEWVPVDHSPCPRCREEKENDT